MIRRYRRNHPHQRQARRQGRVRKRAAKLVMNEQSLRLEKMAANIFLCSARCPSSLYYCRKEFLTAHNRGKHELEGNHDFPQTFSSTDKVVDIACTPGGLMAVGTRKDRKKSPGANLKVFESVAEGTLGAIEACCYGCFHRKDDATKAYHKPWKLQAMLDTLFAKRPKLSPEQARALMKGMIDPEDGGLMFCYSKRGDFVAKRDPRYADWAGCQVCGVPKDCECNGMLLSLDQITNAFSSRASKEKKQRKDEGVEELDYSAARGRVDCEIA